MEKKTIFGFILLTLFLGSGVTAGIIGFKVHKNGENIVEENFELGTDSVYITWINIGDKTYYDLSVSVSYYPEYISTSGNVTIILPLGSTVDEDTLLNDYVNGSGYSGFYRYEETGDLNDFPGVVATYSEIIAPDNNYLRSAIQIVVIGVNDDTGEFNPTPIHVTIEISYEFQDFWQLSTVLFVIAIVIGSYSVLFGFRYFKRIDSDTDISSLLI